MPRTFPRQEQSLRARLLAESGVVRYLLPERATPEALIDEVLQGLERPRPQPGWGLHFTGLERATRELRRAVKAPGRPARSRHIRRDVVA